MASTVNLAARSRTYNGKVLAYTGKVTQAQGTRTFAVSKWVAAKAKGHFIVNKTTGKITVKKSTLKGSYKFQAKVTAKGNANYKSGSKAVTVTVVVR